MPLTLSRRIIAASVAGVIGLGALAAAPAMAEEVAQQTEAREHPRLAEWRQERRAARQEAMAAQLGITVEEYRAAVVAAHEAVVAELGPIDPDNPPDDAALSARRDARQAALAEALGISVDELRAAARVVLEDRLDELVANGRITQEQADEALAAFDDGVLYEYLQEHRPNPDRPGPFRR
jgi:hypothetical protein